ncbi:MAG TPA: hypothetical protein VF584_14060 [Longimicrobium sp.]
MSLSEALAKTVTDRVRRADLSAWQKAVDVAEFQHYLRTSNQPHSTRDLARLLQIPQSRVAEQLTIASELGAPALARYGVSVEAVGNADHRALLRIAKLPHYLREKPIRDCARGADAGKARELTGAGAVTRERRRASVFEKLRDEGQLLIDIPRPIVTLTPSEARSYLDEFLPALAHLAEMVKGSTKSHYIGLAGNGGIVIYLSPSS